MASSVKEKRPTRERLVRAGVHFFQTQGYHGTGITQILERARAPKGCFYHHFPGGKEELAVATLAWVEIGVVRYLEELVASGASSDEMVQGIARFTAEGLRTISRGSLFAALAQDAAADSPAIASALRGLDHAMRSRVVAARRREHPGLDAAHAERFAVQALAIVHGAGVLARVDGRPEATIEIVNEWLESHASQGGRHG